MTVKEKFDGTENKREKNRISEKKWYTQKKQVQLIYDTCECEEMMKVMLYLLLWNLE